MLEDYIEAGDINVSSAFFRILFKYVLIYVIGKNLYSNKRLCFK
ncbi:hypothetical protein CLL_A0572 [Clostridium botulinum B str. Eklund 17B (NRP)]|uniref:Uncharacterized protein n=1 Tax=Clostridium botulinum (strain Eklund 17B / Type B) TaxID=935198 RepID=B2TK65_CLOBB|nr:hypothetical protein CLL_A0572 [Clostridium botulinum B str. Eklund 17B (NRP)]